MDTTMGAAGPEVFGEPISTYSRAQALEDGALVDLRTVDEATVVEAGFRIPIAATQAVHEECIMVHEEARRRGESLRGRLWDVLMMFRHAIPAAPGSPSLDFDLYVTRPARERPVRTTIRARIDGGDTGAPVLTLMFPEED